MKAKAAVLRNSVCANCGIRVYWRADRSEINARTGRDHFVYQLCDESTGGVHRCRRSLTQSVNSPIQSAIV